MGLFQGEFNSSTRLKALCVLHNMVAGVQEICTTCANSTLYKVLPVRETLFARVRKPLKALSMSPLSELKHTPTPKPGSAKRMELVYLITTCSRFYPELGKGSPSLEGWLPVPNQGGHY